MLFIFLVAANVNADFYFGFQLDKIISNSAKFILYVAMLFVFAFGYKLHKEANWVFLYLSSMLLTDFIISSAVAVTSYSLGK